MVEFKVKNKDCSVSLGKECLVIEESLAKVNSKLKMDLIFCNEKYIYIFFFTLIPSVSFESLVLFTMCKNSKTEEYECKIKKTKKYMKKKS